MRARWYGDKRDIVKWGAVVVLAQERSIRAVLQVAFCRPDRLSIDETAKDLPDEVMKHFRDLDDIHRLEEKAGLRIEIHKDDFSPRTGRRAYLEKLATKIKEFEEPVIVLLDPDTGIAPNPKNYGYEHVTPREIQTVLQAMKPKDLLLFYQHKRLGDNRWRDSTKKEFCAAVGENTPVSVIRGRDIADDVLFFAVEWSRWSAPAPSNPDVKSPKKPTPPVPNGDDVIINTEGLTWREVINKQVKCPCCHDKVFKKWPLGWDPHSRFNCPNAHGGSPDEKQADFRKRFGHLFRS